MGAARNDGGAVGWSDTGVGLTEGVFAGEEGVTRGRAGGGRAIAAGEGDAFSREFIDVRGLDLLRAVGGDVAVAEVIGHDHDDVGFVSGGGGGDETTDSEGRESDERFGGEFHFKVGWERLSARRLAPAFSIF